MIIGNFKTTGDTINGVIKTLTFTTEAAFEPLNKTTDKGPDFRVTDGHRELGVAWKKTSTEGKAYYSVRFDDPSFAAPIDCALVKREADQGYILVWERNRKRS